MKTIIREHKTGKTTDLIEISFIKGDTIICSDVNEKRNISIRAIAMDMKIPEPIIFNDFINHKYNESKISGFLIDDCDLLLQSMSAIPINGISLNKDEDIEYWNYKKYDESFMQQAWNQTLITKFNDIIYKYYNNDLNILYNVVVPIEYRDLIHSIMFYDNKTHKIENRYLIRNTSDKYSFNSDEKYNYMMVEDIKLEIVE